MSSQVILARELCLGVVETGWQHLTRRIGLVESTETGSAP